MAKPPSLTFNDMAFIHYTVSSLCFTNTSLFIICKISFIPTTIGKNYLTLTAYNTIIKIASINILIWHYLLTLT